MVTVIVALPGFRSDEVGTVTVLRVNPKAVRLKPGTPSRMLLSVPLWPPAESTIVVPDVSSMCHSAWTPGVPFDPAPLMAGGGDGGCFLLPASAAAGEDRARTQTRTIAQRSLLCSTIAVSLPWACHP